MDRVRHPAPLMLPGEEEDIPADDERWNLEGAAIWDRQVAPDLDLPDPPRTEQFVLEPRGEQRPDRERRR